MEHHFPKLDLDEYIDKFFYAERHFNQIQLEDVFLADNRFMEMKSFLNQKCLVYPTCQMTLHNLFGVHFAFFDEKIGINYHVKSNGKPFTHQPNEMQKLASKILKYEDWEIFDLSEVDFDDWKTNDKVGQVKGWLKEAKER